MTTVLEKDRMISRNMRSSREVRKVFNIGDWVFGTGKHEGCSEVFEGAYRDFQPFSYLDDYDPSHFRLATPEEIENAKHWLGGGTNE